MSLVKPFRHALPVNEALFNEAIYLTHAGWEQVRPGDRYPTIEAPIFYFEWREGRILPEFCLALNIAGGGDIETRGHRGRIQTGDAFLFRPGEWHRHRPSPKTGWTIMWIHFNGEQPLRWLHENAFHLKNNIPVVANQRLFRAQFEHLLGSIEQRQFVNSISHSLQAIGLISHFVLDTHDHPVIDPVWKLYSRAIELVGPTATLLEWDDRIPSFEEVHKEALKAKKFEPAKAAVAS